jgi:prolyl-tRNA synthetase
MARAALVKSRRKNPLMAKQPKHAIQPTRAEDYPEWYQQVVKGADLAEMSDVRGCMVIKPWGFALWENMQRVLDQMFKDTGHENAYFPLFIPMSFLEKEAEHVEGFAKECAVVTHHRLEPGPDGGLVPAAPLDEPLVVRPTSETIIGATYARWVQSYRDLPILINQWANVVRWEMRTRMFLRTTEFLWQEGHTVHATHDEAMEETLRILDLYADFAENYMAIPVIKGEKTADERFPGAVATYSIEALLQDRKALQMGTSHFLGQNFSRAQEIKFQDQNGEEVYAWTTSWGVSTRLIGGLIMMHSDDDGLVLPPRLAPAQVVILPIYRDADQRSRVLDYCTTLKQELEDQRFAGVPIRVRLDDRDLRGGEKQWQHIKRGVPIRLEIGPRDVEAAAAMLGRRDMPVREKASLARDAVVAGMAKMLEEIQTGLYQRAVQLRESATLQFDDLGEFEAFFTPRNRDKPEIHGGLAECHFCECPTMAQKLAALRATVRCVPLQAGDRERPCLFCGRPTCRVGFIAKAY